MKVCKIKSQKRQSESSVQRRKREIQGDITAVRLYMNWPDAESSTQVGGGQLEEHLWDVGAGPSRWLRMLSQQQHSVGSAPTQLPLQGTQDLAAVFANTQTRSRENQDQLRGAKVRNANPLLCSPPL